MPQLPQYLARAQPHGTVAPVIPDAPRVGGLVAGVTNAANTIQRADAWRAAKAEQDAERMAREADQIAREEAQSAVSLTMSAKRAEYTEKIITRQQSGEPLAGMTAALLKEFDADAEKTIAATPELGRRALTMRMAELKSHLHEKAFGMEADARRAQVVTDFSTGLDADSRVLFADHSQFGPILAARLAAAETLTLDPQTKAKALANTRETLAYAAASGLVDKNPDAFLARTGNAGGKIGKDGKPLPSDPAKAAEAVKSDPMLSNMEPKQLQALTERATTMVVQRNAMLEAQREAAARKAEIAANKLRGEQAQAYQIVSTRAIQGIPTAPDAPEMRILAGSIYAPEVRRMTEQIGARSAVAMLPIPQQQAQLDALNAQRTKGTNQALDAEVKAREGVLAGARKDFAADPLRAAAERGLIVAVAPLDMGSIDAMMQGLPARVQQASTASMQTGEPVAPLTPDEVPKLAKHLFSLPASQRAERLAQITAGLPPTQGQALAKQLAGGQDDQSRALGYAMAYGNSRTTQGRTVAEIMLKGAEALKAKTIKEETTAVDGWRGQIAEQVSPLFPNPQQAATVAESARFILAGLVAEGASGNGADAKQAVRLAIGGTASEINGARVVIPAGLEEKDVRARMRTMTPADIKAQSTDGRVYVSGASMTAEQFLAGLPDAQLRYAGRGRYHVIAGGTLAANSMGNPITIEVAGAR